ncbi:putative ubiquitinyl hydrolase 1 [Helianthus debilis subsp. tardiflorus]
MEDLLYVNGFHQPIICSEKPEGMTEEEWNLLHRRVCGYIRHWVDENVLTHVSREVNARTVWSILEQLYAGNTCHSKLFLIKRLMGLRYHDETSMSDHLNIFWGIINQLSEIGVTIDEEVQGLLLLGTLPNSWETLGTSLLNSTPNGVISMELAKNSVLNEEMRRKSQGSTLRSESLAAAEPHLYTTIKVARDVDLHEQIGKHIFFDLVDYDKVFCFCIQKHISFSLFKEEVAKELGIPVQYQRFWFCARRVNHTYRPDIPFTPQEEALPVGQLRGVSKTANNAELKLFLEDSRPVPPPAITKKDILLFFKLYDPFKEELRYVGRLFVNGTSSPKEILAKLNELAGFAPDVEIELFEEVKFNPNVMCLHVNKELTFWASEFEDGDIICFQKRLDAGTVACRYPYLPSFLEHVHYRQNTQEEEGSSNLQPTMMVQ